jgi:hypothetical protein
VNSQTNPDHAAAEITSDGVKTGQVIIKEQIQDIWTRTQESNKKV